MELLLCLANLSVSAGFLAARAARTPPPSHVPLSPMVPPPSIDPAHGSLHPYS